jgi:hypothetical protein
MPAVVVQPGRDVHGDTLRSLAGVVLELDLGAVDEGDPEKLAKK